MVFIFNRGISLIIISSDSILYLGAGEVITKYGVLHTMGLSNTIYSFMPFLPLVQTGAKLFGIDFFKTLYPLFSFSLLFNFYIFFS